jgi:carotenoid cleavage dioxygenase-like enzyme
MDPLLTVDGVLPPDLQGTLLRIGPADGAGGGGVGGGGGGGGGGAGGILHAIELRDGTAISHLRQESPADANVLWQAGKVLALSESGLPHQYSRLLAPEEFGDGLKVPVASHLHRDAVSGGRVLFGVEPGTEESSALLRVGEWDSAGGLVSSGVLELERATWQHDLGVTARHLVVIESPTQWAADLAAPVGESGSRSDSESSAAAVPFRWVPTDECWLAVLPRGGDFSQTRWFKLNPCLVTHVLHAHDVEEEAASGVRGNVSNGNVSSGDVSNGDVVLYVCCYPAPERHQPFDWEAPVVGPDGIGQSFIGGGLGRLERWTIRGDRLEREPLDERHIEYPRSDPLCEGRAFRYGYSVEQSASPRSGVVDHLGLLRFDVLKDEVVAWQPGDHCTASEPIFVRSVEGHADDEGWLLTFVHDAALDTSALYVLDASSLRRRPQAIIHLPATVPFRSHSEWVGADRYR